MNRKSFFKFLAKPTRFIDHHTIDHQQNLTYKNQYMQFASEQTANERFYLNRAKTVWKLCKRSDDRRCQQRTRGDKFQRNKNILDVQYRLESIWLYCTNNIVCSQTRSFFFRSFIYKWNSIHFLDCRNCKSFLPVLRSGI